MSRVLALPSGSELTVNVAPFKDSKALFQAIAKEWKNGGVESFSSVSGMTAMFMSAFSSIEVEKALWPCLTRSLYNGEKIVPDTFEPEQARQDFIPVCLEVVAENITPFMSNLFSGLGTQSQVPSGNPK